LHIVCTATQRKGSGGLGRCGAAAKGDDYGRDYGFVARRRGRADASQRSVAEVGMIIQLLGKMFLSEEKNQKTFLPSLADRSGLWPRTAKLRRKKSLLLLFFRKEGLSS
jgi:hypothetical protein